jgi:hypothetical protein
VTTMGYIIPGLAELLVKIEKQITRPDPNDFFTPAHQGFQKWDSSQLSRHGPDRFLKVPRKHTEESLSNLLSNPALIAKTINRMNDVFNGGGIECNCFN